LLSLTELIEGALPIRASHIVQSCTASNIVTVDSDSEDLDFILYVLLSEQNNNFGTNGA
jgi:hypothetical protein